MNIKALLYLLLIVSTLAANPIRLEEPTIQEIVRTKYPYMIVVYGVTNTGVHEIYAEDQFSEFRDFIKHAELKKETGPYFKAALLAAGLTSGIGIIVACGLTYYMSK